MKFGQLPIGVSFELDGCRYVKSSPILATAEGGGQRLIARFVVVRPLDGAAPAAPAAEPQAIDPSRLRSLLEEHQRRCEALIEAAARGSDPVLLHAELRQARQRLFEELGLAGETG